MKKLIAIAFSDIHLNNWSKFNREMNRTDSSLLVLSQIFKEGIKNKVPILFCGDMIHTQESINMDLQIKLSEFYDRYSCELKLHVYGINGNHDLPNSNSFKRKSKGYLHTLIPYPWIKCIDFETIELDDFVLHGIPYLDNNVGLKDAIKNIKINKYKKNILLLHTDYDGARDNDGRVIGSVENLDRSLLRKFSLVLCGHIHKPQKLNKNVYMVGAPQQQRFTDEGCNKLGYMKIYSDMSVKFKKIKGTPKFITITDEKDEKDDGNYYRIVSKKEIKQGDKEEIINPNLSRSRIAKRYLRIKGIKDKDKRDLLIKVLKEANDD